MKRKRPPSKPTDLAIAKSQTITLDNLRNFAQVKVAAMTFSELSTFVQNGITCIEANWSNIDEAREAVRPALIRLHSMCGGQGKRNDLAGGITWTAVCNNFSLLGCKRTLDALIKDAELDNPLKQPQLHVRDQVLLPATTEVIEGADRHVSRVAKVTKVHEISNPQEGAKVDVEYVTPEGAKTETVRAAEVQKVKAPKPNEVSVNDTIWLMDIDGGSEYRYNGMKPDGTPAFERTTTPSRVDEAKFALDEKEVAKARRKREADEASAAKKAAAKEAKRLADEVKAAAKKAEAEKVAAAKTEAAAQPKKRGGKRATKYSDVAVEVVARKLGDKFFLFAKNEVEFSSRTVRGSHFDTMEAADNAAIRINIKGGFVGKRSDGQDAEGAAV